MILYKLTNANSESGLPPAKPTTWSKGFHPPRLDGYGPLCTRHWYHAYSSPLLAVLLDPIHGDFGEGRRCYRVKVNEADVGDLDSGLKFGFKTGLVLDEVPLPEVTLVQKIAFGILCSLESPQPGKYFYWAPDWLSGKNRSCESAEAVRESAARTAWAMVDATRAEAVAVAAEEESAADAAEAAAEAAEKTGKRLDLQALAEKAMKVKEKP